MSVYNGSLNGPLPIKTHVLQGKSRFTSRYRNASNLLALWTAVGNQIQLLEDAIWGVIVGRILTWGTGVVIPYGDGTPGGLTLVDSEGANLDDMGSFLDEPRRGRSDADYVLGLRLRILADRSSGSADDLQTLAVQSVPGTAAITYNDYYPAAFEISVVSPPVVQPLADLLAIAKPPGVAGSLIAGDDDTITWDDVPLYTLAPIGWADTVDTTTNNFGDAIALTP